MFAEWVTMGVQIGIMAFFGLFTFLLCAAVILGLLTMLMQIFRVEDAE